MAKYKAYPEYKDSGVEWLGEVPCHWKVISISRLFFRTKRAGYTEKELLSVYRDYGVIPKSSREDNNNKPSEDLSPYQLVQPNDLVMNKMKAWQGSIAISEYEGIVSPAYFVYQPNKVLFEQAYPRYVHYLLRNPIYVTQYLSCSKGIRVNQWDLDPDEFRKIELLLPTKHEQKKIYSFLDHETAKIDNLIDKQKQLIELLKEKRQAVISHAVTNGLNPDVPMKDSGVEWLGEVPEHWVVAQLKFNTLEMQTGPFGSQLHAEDYIVDGIPLINPAHMNSGEIIPDLQVTVDEATQKRLERHKLLDGEIIFSRRGELGRCAVVKKEHEGWLCGTGSLKAKLTKKIIPDYAYILISSEGVVSELILESKGSTMANLNTETLGRVRLPVPPIREQEAILDYIKVISDKYDYLILSADTAIRLMQERRTALISAAVIGKIDVRNWVAPNTQDVEESQEAAA
ncbi:restriction endonuclease subunit S [Xenorhabdus doucetiae]|uniref:Type I restriction enzyme S subunit n=1 Tax=Xenorhabdus doucetiae TaxID=351671 RepID=A0A068QUI4_9GAMM|nr:restriction endonuclease subunit S [Xenorhabdus doucetiae]TYP07033.1 type I restriction enzyme S subunit [Xenorhabdus doucetiae]CDG18648.1 Type I restriction-modification system specificity subunit [Xenorhabdus doucetiae]